jgi:hypothetical protein
MPSDERLSALAERLDADGQLATGLELDALTTLRELGFEDLAPTIEQERDRIGELVERIYREDDLRRRVEEDPIAELVGWGIPDLAVAPVLMLAGAPDYVIERATADVEAHLLGRKGASVAAMGAIIGTLAFAQQASAGNAPAAAGLQNSPAAGAQVLPAAQAQVTPAAYAQVTPAAQAQISKPQVSKPQIAKPQVSKAQVQPAASALVAKAGWKGIQPQKLTAQARIALLLGAQGTGL